ncbi:MAG: DeoR/GlpR transcriptional regulator [Planctomycetaceae bacterium]|nr:DeoR/GlpR transcriptional regulator [Planctomycetaceae bacterium]
MLPDKRRNDILDIVETKGFASLQEISEAISASESTIRRDLEFLDGLGKVRRTRGGAAYIGESLDGFDDRRNRSLPEKQKIAKAAADLIGDGETILLDGGTTTLEVARNLSSSGKTLQVVTNSLPIQGLLVGTAKVELIALGGFLYPKSGVALGELTIGALRQIHARRLIMGVGGVTPAGLFNSNSLLVETERQMLEVADEVIVVADSTKLGHSELVHLATLDRIDRFVTDEGITDSWKDIFSSHNVELTIA